MELIPYSELKKLLKTNVDETDETPKFDYEDFKEFYLNLTKTENQLEDLEELVPKHVYFKILNQYLSNVPSIKLVGKGSSRSAFMFEQGKCLKLAINIKGIAQNKAEIANTFQTGYNCFSEIYNFDKDTYGSLIVECGTKLKDDDLKNLYGKYYDSMRFPYEIKSFISRMIKFNFDINEYISIESELIKEYEENLKPDNSNNYKNKYKDEYKHMLKTHTRRFNFAQNIKDNKAPEYEVIRELVRFYKDNGEEAMITEDLANDENWALAIRDNKLVPVVIDAGFSSEVCDTYYS